MDNSQWHSLMGIVTLAFPSIQLPDMSHSFFERTESVFWQITRPVALLSDEQILAATCFVDSVNSHLFVDRSHPLVQERTERVFCSVIVNRISTSRCWWMDLAAFLARHDHVTVTYQLVELLRKQCKALVPCTGVQVMLKLYTWPDAIQQRLEWLINKRGNVGLAIQFGVFCAAEFEMTQVAINEGFCHGPFRCRSCMKKSGQLPCPMAKFITDLRADGKLPEAKMQELIIWWGLIDDWLAVPRETPLSDESLQTLASILKTIVTECHRCNLDATTYFRDTLAKLSEATERSCIGFFIQYFYTHEICKQVSVPLAMSVFELLSTRPSWDECFRAMWDKTLMLISLYRGAVLRNFIVEHVLPFLTKFQSQSVVYSGKNLGVKKILMMAEREHNLALMLVLTPVLPQTADLLLNATRHILHQLHRK